MYATLIVVAVLWGTATGLLLPRAAYRLSVEPEDAWRDSCPAGHPITGLAGGWLGGARCARCASCEAVGPSGTAESSGVDAKSPGVGTGRAATGPTSAALDPSSPAADPGSPPPGPASAAPDPTKAATDPAGATTDACATTDRVGAGATTDPVGPAADPATGSARPAADGSGARARYAPSLLVPLLTALACAVLAATTGPRPELAVWLLLAPFAVLLALVDRNVHRLPDRLTLPLAAAAAVLLGVAALFPGGGSGDSRSWSTALLGGLALGACYFVLFLINPNGMGFGDVKLALSLGVALGWYGWLVLFVGAFAGFLLGSLYGLGLILLRRAGRKSAIPFGPFMIVGALIGIVLGALVAT